MLNTHPPNEDLYYPDDEVHNYATIRRDHSLTCKKRNKQNEQKISVPQQNLRKLRVRNSKSCFRQVNGVLRAELHVTGQSNHAGEPLQNWLSLSAGQGIARNLKVRNRVNKIPPFYAVLKQMITVQTHPIKISP